MVNLIDTIYNTIVNEMEKYMNDEYFESFILMEGISYGSSIRTKSVFDLAGLNYLIRYKLIKVFNHSKFTIVPPSELKKFTTGKGNANKEIIIELFKILYPNLTVPKLDDIADAYFMISSTYISSCEPHDNPIITTLLNRGICENIRRFLRRIRTLSL